MSTPQPPIHATIEAHPSDWQSILAAVFQGVQIFGPFIIQLVAAQKGTAQVTIHSLPTASNGTEIKKDS